MQKNIIRLAIITFCILLIPVIGMQVSSEWNWTAFDFVFAGVLIFGTGLAYLLISKRAGTTAYKGAVGLGLLTGFLLVWINGAVGIIGDDGPANPLYLGVLVLGLICAIIARLEARGMMRTLFIMAAAQFLVPLIVLFVWPSELELPPGMLRAFVLNTIFVALWTGSGLLFRQASLAKGATLNR